MEYRSDELKHHGTLGMKWGQRNGPPYPLQRFQKAAGEAIIKGKRVMGDAYEREKVKYKAKIAKEIKRKEAEREDLEKRKAERAKRNRLKRMPVSLLTKQELDDLTNRKKSENSYKELVKHKKKKQQNKELADVKRKLVSEVVNPVVVELGKSAVAAMIAGGDFGKIATSRITKTMFMNNSQQKQNNQSNNSQQKKKPKLKKTSGSFKKK